MADDTAGALAHDVRRAVVDYFAWVVAVIQDGAEPEAEPQEFLGHWEDWLAAHGGELIPAILSDAEQSADLAYHAAWIDAVLETPEDVHHVREARGLPEWLRLQEVAQRALAVFEGVS